MQKQINCFPVMERALLENLAQMDLMQGNPIEVGFTAGSSSVKEPTDFSLTNSLDSINKLFSLSRIVRAKKTKSGQKWHDSEHTWIPPV